MTTVDVHSGNLWASGSGHLNLLPTEQLALAIHNPATANGHLVLLLLVAGAEQTMFLETWINPTAGLPTTAKRIDNIILDGRAYPGGVTVKADATTTAFSGGIRTDTSVTIGPSGLAIPFEMHIPPGNTLGFQTLPRPGNNTVSVGFSFTELD